MPENPSHRSPAPSRSCPQPLTHGARRLLPPHAKPSRRPSSLNRRRIPDRSGSSSPIRPLLQEPLPLYIPLFLVRFRPKAAPNPSPPHVLPRRSSSTAATPLPRQPSTPATLPPPEITTITPSLVRISLCPRPSPKRIGAPSSAEARTPSPRQSSRVLSRFSFVTTTELLRVG